MDTDVRNSVLVIQENKPTWVIDGSAPVTFIVNVAASGTERRLTASLKNAETGQRIPLLESPVRASADVLGQASIHSLLLIGVPDGSYTLNVFEEDGQRFGHAPILVRKQRRPDCGS